MKKYRIIVGPRSVQGSREWLDFRKDKITASMAPSIMGVGFQTRLQLFESIVYDQPIKKSLAMERGNDLEPKARQWLNMTLDRDYEPEVIQSIDNPSFIASLDGFYLDEEGNAMICEIKCPGPVDHSTAVSGLVPDKYYPQLCFQMIIAGVTEMVYCSFDGRDGAIIHVKLDEDYARELMHECKIFRDNVIEMIPPKATDKDWVNVEDGYLGFLLDEYNELCNTADQIDEKKKSLKEQITKSIEHPRSKIGKNRIQRITKKGEVDYPKIFEDLGLDIEVDKYRKPGTTFWKISY